MMKHSHHNSHHSKSHSMLRIAILDLDDAIKSNSNIVSNEFTAV
jgi:hypothetical protein